MGGPPGRARRCASRLQGRPRRSRCSRIRSRRAWRASPTAAPTTRCCGWPASGRWRSRKRRACRSRRSRGGSSAPSSTAPTWRSPGRARARRSSCRSRSRAPPPRHCGSGCGAPGRGGAAVSARGPRGRAGRAGPGGQPWLYGARRGRGRAGRRAAVPAATPRAGVTVLVTGGSGLVGSHVISALKSAGETVRALVHPRSRDAVVALGAEPIEGDTRDPDAWRVAAAGARAIVHAAAIVAAKASHEEFFAVNVGGTGQAITAAREAGARLVHVSSVAVYGRTRALTAEAGGAGVDEAFPFGELQPHDFYAQSKRRAEEVLWEEVARGGLAATVIRPNVIYGEYDRLFSPRVVQTLRLGFILQVGPGTNRLSCVYAGNVAAAVVRAIDAPAASGRAYNVTDDGPASLTQRGFVDAFAQALGVRVRRVKLPYSVARFVVDWWVRAQFLLRPGTYPGVSGQAVRFLAGDNHYSSARDRRGLSYV